MLHYFQTPWLLHLTFGLMVGGGVGLGFTASLVAIGQYFERLRPMAYGIGLLGAGLSGMTLNPLFTFTQEYDA